LREHLRQLAGGGLDRAVSITATPGGFVALNHNIRIDEESFKGRYFQHLPLHLRAVAHKGFRFKSWEGTSERGSAFTLELRADDPPPITAVFEPFTHPLAGQIHISELSPASQDGDWLEIHNASDEIVELHGWQLTDDDHVLRLPDQQLPPGGYLLLAEKPERFSEKMNVAKLPFGLSKKGEDLGLYAPDGAFVDRIRYTVEAAKGDFVILPYRDDFVAQSGPGTPGTDNPITVVSQVSTPDYWLRIAVGLGVLVLVVLLRVLTTPTEKTD